MHRQFFRSWWKTSLVPLLFVVFIFSSGCSDSYDSPIPPVANTPIKVMSYNLRYGDLGIVLDEDSRRDPLVASINEHKPDFLGVQEANEPWMEVLPELLQDYAFVGVGRDDGIAAGEFAAIFYLKDRWTVIDSGTFWLSETPAEPSYGWGANHRRICTWAFFQNIVSGEVVAHFNTHLDHESEQARVNGTRLILDEVARSPYPALFTGDLNFPEGSEQYEVIQATSLADTKFLAAESIPYGTINFFLPNVNDLGLVIDFVFVQPEYFDVLKYEVDYSREYAGLAVSDHYPVIADLELKH
jgi:endonuclease/exonuclease/phosphatase family metal-dependent hydrolase